MSYSLSHMLRYSSHAPNYRNSTLAMFRLFLEGAHVCSSNFNKIFQCIPQPMINANSWSAMECESTALGALQLRTNNSWECTRLRPIEHCFAVHSTVKKGTRITSADHVSSHGPVNFKWHLSGKCKRRCVHNCSKRA